MSAVRSYAPPAGEASERPVSRTQPGDDVHPDDAAPAEQHPAYPDASDGFAADSLGTQLSAADSLPSEPFAVDSLQTAPLAIDSLRTADSLSAEFALPADASPWRDTTARAVFGTESRIVVPGRLAVSQAPSLTDNPVFQGFVLLLAATYAMLLYRNLADVGLLLDRVSRDRASAKRLSEESGASGFSRFLHIATAIGMLFLGVMVVKYGDSLLPRTLSDALSHGAVVALSLSATLVCVAVAAFQTGLLRSAGALVLAQPFVSQLLLLKRTYFSLAVIVTSPALLLFALCPRGTGDVWFCIIVVELLVTAVVYLRETLNLFLAKKVSILHWFLYLCAVEVFPISFIWLIAAR